MNPNFFLIGPPKCATTAISRHLSSHPDIFMCEPKEPCYFIYTNGNPYGWPARGHPIDVDTYTALFQHADNAKVIGEASPYYIYCEHCAEAIREFQPDAKILAILRNPIERAYSMYLYWNQENPKAEKVDYESFREAFLNDSYVHDFNPPGQSNFKVVKWLRDMGYYGRQLKAYYNAFPREQILVVRYEDLVRDTAECLLQIYRFLDVDPTLTSMSLDRVNATVVPRWRSLYNWLNLNRTSRIREICKLAFGRIEQVRAIRTTINRLNTSPISIKNRLSGALYDELIRHYAQDIEYLSDLTRMDFTNWLSTRDLQLSVNAELLRRA
jgi:hypothetical protein